MPLIASVLVLASITVLSPSADVDKPQEPVGVWKEFRKAYPYHIQTVAVSQADKEGGRTIVVAEPPPHVTPEQIRATVEKHARKGVVTVTLKVEQHPIGHDGWVRDAVVAASIEERMVPVLVASLNRLQFDTSYKAHYLELPQTKQKATTFPLELRVSASELKRWLLEDRGNFVSAQGGEPQRVEDVLALGKSGVYADHKRGLVVWWLPKNTKVDRCRAEARQFALDSDLILGGVAKANGLLVVGRERIVPIDALPPLRAETIAMLASVRRAELGQSFERNHAFAGRFRDGKHVLDVAPIYLSPELVNTEYGSLLNIADQLLKGWSQKGETLYENFEYPQPSKWPFDVPADQHLKADQLVYNWNTSGCGYVVNAGDNTIFALERTGALPVTYIGSRRGKHVDSSAAEMQAQDYFANERDPHLVRVVQYTALYQMFRAFRVEADVAPASGPRLTTEAQLLKTFKAVRDLSPRETDQLAGRLETHFKELAKGNLIEEFLNGITNGKETLAKELKQLASRLKDGEADVEKLSLEAIRRLEELRKKSGGAGAVAPKGAADRTPAFGTLAYLLQRLEDKGEDRGLAILASLTASPRDWGEVQVFLGLAKIAAEEEEKIPPNLRQLWKELQPHADDLTTLAKTLSTINLDRRTTEILQAISALNGMHKEYAVAMTRGVEGPIHTPCLVRSWVVGERAGVMSGGHNIGTRVVRIEADGKIATGKFDLKAGREVVLRVHPDDVSKATQAVRALARGADVPTIEKSVQTALGGGEPPRRPPTVALSFPPDGGRPRPEDIFRQAARTGWELNQESPREADVKKLMALQEVNEDTVLVIREGKGKHRIVHGRAARDGTGCYQIDAWTYEDTVDALDTLLTKRAETSKSLDIHVKGFEDWEFEGLLSTLRIRRVKAQDSTRHRIVRNTPEPTTFKEWVTKEVKLTDPKVESTASTDGKVFQFKVRDASLDLRVGFEKSVPKGRIQRFLDWLSDIIGRFFVGGGTIDGLGTHLQKRITEELKLLEMDGINLGDWHLEIRGKGGDLLFGWEDGQHAQQREFAT